MNQPGVGDGHSSAGSAALPRNGDPTEVERVADRRAGVASKCGTSAAVMGMLEKPGTPCLSIEEMDDIAASGWGWRGMKTVAVTNVLLGAVAGLRSRGANAADPSDVGS